MPPFIVSDITLTKRGGIIAFIHVLFEMGLQYVANKSVMHKDGTLIQIHIEIQNCFDETFFFCFF